MIHYLIVDDEPIAHRIIEKYCDNLPHLDKKGNCYNAFEAMQFLNENEVKLLFLDINMPKLSGFDFLKTMSNPPKIIVTTAYKEFALEGYELNISDYLLKPFSFERFVKAINKTIANTTVTQESISKTVITKGKTESKSFFLKGDKKYHQVHIKSILFYSSSDCNSELVYKLLSQALSRMGGKTKNPISHNLRCHPAGAIFHLFY